MWKIKIISKNYTYGSSSHLQFKKFYTLNDLENPNPDLSAVIHLRLINYLKLPENVIGRLKLNPFIFILIIYEWIFFQWRPGRLPSGPRKKWDVHGSSLPRLRRMP